MVTLDGLYAAWHILNELLGELNGNGVFIPKYTYADMRNAKMVIEYLRSFDEDIQSFQRSDIDLREEMEGKMLSLRESLMVWAEENQGVIYRQNWEQRFERALRGEEVDIIIEEQVPISDIPREKDVGFFRIRLPDEIPVEVISEIAEDCRVIISLDGDRHLQVSGKKECVRDAMQRLGQLFYGESRIS